MHSPQCQTFRPFMTLFKAPQLVTTFLSNSLKTLVTRTFTNGFPSVTSVLQHLVFNMFFHDVLFTAPSPLPGGDEKVILIFRRSPVNYSTGLCIAYPLHQGSPISDYKIFSSVQSSVVSDSLRPHESQHARPPCPSPTPGIHSDSRPSSQ